MHEPELHPIKDVISGVIGDGEGKLSDAGQAQIRAALDALTKEPTHELMHAVASVFAIADFLEDQGANAIAQQLIAMLDAKNVVDAMKVINQGVSTAIAEDVANTGHSFSQFSGESGPVAPSVDARAPKDSVKLNALDFPKRL